MKDALVANNVADTVASNLNQIHVHSNITIIIMFFCLLLPCKGGDIHVIGNKRDEKEEKAPGQKLTCKKLLFVRKITMMMMIKAPGQKLTCIARNCCF